MQTKIENLIIIQLVILIAAFLFGNSAFAEEGARIEIDITINGAAGENDYIVYWYSYIIQKNIKENYKAKIFTGKPVKFVAYGNFKNWEGSSCGNSSGRVLEFKSSGDCTVVANFGENTNTERRLYRKENNGVEPTHSTK